VTEVEPSRMAQAIAAIDGGDIGALRALLAAHPKLVRERVTIDDEPYRGYFAGAQLLHHVAFNPCRGGAAEAKAMPANIAEVARLLLSAGAEVDATCGDAEDRPGSGGTTLGLVASSALAAERGVAPGLIDVLLEHGADLEQGRGAPLYAAVYHTVECKKQRDVAAHLRARGARADLAMAAGLGECDTIEALFLPDGTLEPEAYPRFRMDRLADPDDDAVIQEACVFACMNGRTEIAGILLERGAAIDGVATVAGMQVTPLHAAAWAGWPETAALLIAHGADMNRRDPVHTSSAVGWAEHCGRKDVLELLTCYRDRFDLANAVEFGASERACALLEAGDDDPDMEIGNAGRGCLLRTASWLGHAEVVRALLGAGASAGLANREGDTAFSLAEQRGHTEIMRLLRAAASAPTPRPMASRWPSPPR